MTGVLDVDHAAPRERLTRTARAGGQHAIHHVDAALYGPYNVGRFANAHEVSRFVDGQHVGRVIQYAEHGLLPFAHGKPSDRISVKSDINERLGAFGAQIFGDAALLDAKERVSRAIPKRVFGPFRPPHRELHALGHLFVRGGKGRALVKAHDDV